MQLPELRKLAKEKGIKNVSKLKKNELIELLQENENEDTAAKSEANMEIKEEAKEDFVSGNRSI